MKAIFYRAILFFLLALTSLSELKSQVNCADADPFCTATGVTFPAGVNNGTAAPGPDYGCLGSQPNPAWYYLNISTSGNIDITLTNSGNQDIDFILWGPFPNQGSMCGSINGGTSSIDCSYSTAATEFVNIPNAVVGEWYMLLITNFSNANTNISASQSGGAGATNCAILCNMTGLTAVPGPCNSATNTYTTTGTITVANPPTTGTLTITNSCGGSQVINPPFGTSINYSIPNTTATGGGCSITATFSADPTCTLTQNFTSPAPCTVTCNISAVTATPSVCNSANNQYSVSGQITFTNPPASGTLTVTNSCGGSQVFNAPFASPLNYNITGLTSNSAGCTITATFSANAACTNTANYTAPASCNCSLTGVTAVPSACNSANNQYSVSGQITFINPPAAGTLTVTNSCGGSQVFNAPFASPLNYNITGLTSNSAGCTITATFSANAACTNSANYTAPANCLCSLTGVTAVPGSCNQANNQYSLSGQITFTNPPVAGTLTVANSCGGSQVFNAPFVSPLNYTIAGINSDGAACTVTATFSANAACTNTANFTAPAACPGPTVDAGPDQSVCPGSCVTLAGVVNGATGFYWTPSTGLNDSTLLQPTACPTATTSYVLTAFTAGGNIINNGDFSSGNTGFTSDYLFTGFNGGEGEYNVATNPQAWNAGLSPCGDHTTGVGNMMMVNGSAVANSLVYCTTVTVTPNTDYMFSTWVTSLHPTNPAQLQFSINGVLLGNPFSPTGVCTWDEFFTLWNSGANTSVDICIENVNTNINGNDFGIDDITFQPVLIEDDTVTITINGTADATINPAGPFCSNNPSALLVAADPGGTWSGPGITNAATGTFDPAVAGAGNHIIQYLIPGTCGDTATTTIQVIQAADATITPAGPYCVLDNAVTLSAVDAGGTWSGTGITSAANGTFDPGVAGVGTHTITYTISGVCGDNNTTNIVVTNQIPATINPVGPFCVNASSVNLTAVNAGGTWSGPGITNAGAGTFNPTTAGAGTHTITYITPGACGDTSTTTIVVNPLPNISFSADEVSGCTPVVTVFTDNTGLAGSSVLWDFGDNSTSNVSGSATHTYVDPGCYDVSLTVTSAQGCSSTLTQNNMVCVYAIPVADFVFGPQPTTILNTEISFVNLSVGATDYSWNFGGLGTSTVANPTFIFPADTALSYTVCLDVESANGCTNSICHEVIISEQFLVYVPNTFTPDGDGINDIFYPILTGYDPEFFELLIFNRWGEIIFKSTSPDNGWDGTHKGQKAKTDVYVWKIKVKDAAFNDKKSYYGHVNLLRGK